LSLAEQERLVRLEIEREGWQQGEMYVERGVSGRKDDRPELAKLMRSLDEIDVLVIPKLDRLGRSNKHLHDTFEALEAANVALVCLNPNIDTSTTTGKLMRSILAGMAEFESDLIKERVESVVTAGAEKGKKHGAWPLGYIDGEIVQPAAGIILRIFRETAAGMTQRQIAVKLNGEGIRTPTGKEWSQTQIKSVLDCVTYTGRIETNGVIYAGGHEAIVPMELWEEVQALRSVNRRGKNGSAAGAKVKSPHLFTRGLLRCALCGSAMVPTRKGDYEAYGCFSRASKGKDACRMENIPRRVLDAAVFDYFERVCVDVEATRAELEALKASAEVERKAKLREAKAKLAAATAADERLTREYIADEIDGKGYTKLAAGVEQDKADAEAFLAAQPAPMAEPRAIAGTATMLVKLREEIAGKVTSAGGLAGIRARLALLFERFEIGYPGQPVERASSAAEAAVIEQQAAEIEAEIDAIELGDWVVVPVPREDWVGDDEISGDDEIRGYWQSILRPMPLPVMSEGARQSTSRPRSR
jgi:site-specific DNA recombinase